MAHQAQRIERSFADLPVALVGFDIDLLLELVSHERKDRWLISGECLQPVSAPHRYLESGSIDVPSEPVEQRDHGHSAYARMPCRVPLDCLFGTRES